MPQSRLKFWVIGIGLGLAVMSGFLIRNQKAQSPVPADEAPLTLPPERTVDVRNAEATAISKAPQETLSLERKHFIHKTEQLLERLPTVSDFEAQANSGQHTAPALSDELTAELQSVTDLVRNRAELRADGLNFYQACVMQENVQTSLRAVCLTHARRLAQELNRPLKLNSVPPLIEQLANQLKF